jgi:putative NIF3 family GTP cyclohydrolase 1 type 2
MKAREVIDRLDVMIPRAGPNEGLLFGDPDIEVTGILVCWMADVAAIEKAIAEKCNVIVTHADLFNPPSYVRRDRPYARDWRANVARISRLVNKDMVVVRAHAKLDHYSIADEFSRACGMPDNGVREGLVRVHDLEPPKTLREIAAQVKKGLSLEGVRVIGDLDRKIRKVGMASGSIGLSLNMGFWEKLLHCGAECVIAGEVDEHQTRYAVDSGLCVVETGNCVSENPGIAAFAKAFKHELENKVPVIFHDCGRPWECV